MMAGQQNLATTTLLCAIFTTPCMSQSPQTTNRQTLPTKASPTATGDFPRTPGGLITTPDADGDGITDTSDECPGTVAGAYVDDTGCPYPAIPGDSDRDGDVDQVDLDAFQGCISGAAIEIDPQCEGMDFDADDDVDQSDIGIFQRCLSGTDVLANPTCADEVAPIRFVTTQSLWNSLHLLELSGPSVSLLGHLSIPLDQGLRKLAPAAPGFAYSFSFPYGSLVTVRLGDATIVKTVQLDTRPSSRKIGLDRSPEGLLYGVFSGDGPELRTIDPQTGTTTLIGTIDIAVIESIAFGPDGTLYATGNWNPSYFLGSNLLYTIDRSTGLTTLVGSLPTHDIDDLAFARDGYLYGCDFSDYGTPLYRIDPITATLSHGGPTDIAYCQGIVSLNRGF